MFILRFTFVNHVCTFHVHSHIQTIYIYRKKNQMKHTYTHTQSILKGESHRVQLGIENEKIHKIFSCLTVVVKLYIFVHFTVCASVICIIDIKHIKCVWMLWLNRVISFFGFHCSEYIVHVWIYIYILCVDIKMNQFLMEKLWELHEN